MGCVLCGHILRHVTLFAYINGWFDRKAALLCNYSCYEVHYVQKLYINKFYIMTKCDWYWFGWFYLGTAKHCAVLLGTASRSRVCLSCASRVHSTQCVVCKMFTTLPGVQTAWLHVIRQLILFTFLMTLLLLQIYIPNLQK